MTFQGAVEDPAARPLEIGLHVRPTSRPNTSVALVDLDNWHEADAERSIDLTLREVIPEVTARLLEVAPRTAFISVRLYGGWTERGALSQDASMVAAHIADVDPFPIPAGSHLVHGEIHLATTLSMCPGVELGDLFRTRQGPPRLRLANRPRPAGCADSDGCAAKALQKFTERGSRQCPSPGCTVTAGAAFSTRQQKMVDTLMACDLLDFAHDPDVVAISVVTADTDLMPPLVQALALRRPTVVLQTNLPYWPSGQLSTLERCGLIYFGPRGDQDEQP